MQLKVKLRFTLIVLAQHLPLHSHLHLMSSTAVSSWSRDSSTC